MKGRPSEGKVKVAIKFYPPDNRKRDRDNMIASFKSGQDGVADALGMDDALWVPEYDVGGALTGGQVVLKFDFPAIEATMKEGE